MIGSTTDDLSTSPVFPSRQLTSVQSTVSASTESRPVSKLKETNHSSTGASPWLSKERGLNNGKNAVKTAAHSGYQLHSV